MKNYFPITIYTKNRNFRILTLLILFIMLPLSVTTASTTVSTYPVSTITKTTAILNGYVASQDGFSDAWFEFGISSGNLDKKTNQIVVSNNRPFKISTSQTKLEEGTRYFYRAIAVNKDGISRGNIDNFITTGDPTNTPSNNTNNQGGTSIQPIGSIGIGSNALPFVVTNFPQNVTSTSAILKGQSIPAANLPTTVWFEWGTEQNSLNKTTPQTSVNSALSENFDATLTNLAPNTFYYYRAVIRNQNGESRGVMIRMKTLPFITQSTITKPEPQPNTPVKIIKKEVSKEKTNISDEQTASIPESKFFPNTLIGWLILIALLILIIVLGDHMYGERKKRKESIVRDNKS